MGIFEREGDWWLPGRFEDKVPGKLSFEPTSWGELELRIEGRFFHTGFDNDEYPIILGVANAMEFSLLNCKSIGGSKHLTRNYSAQSRKFVIETIFEGHHFESIDDIAFEFISASYTHLDEWMDQRNFRFENGCVRYVKPEPITIQLENTTVVFRADMSNKVSRAEVSMKEHCWIDFTPNETLHFNEYRRFMDIQFPNFLTLATGMPNYPYDIRTQLSKGEMPKEINIYYGVAGYVEKPPPTIIEFMLFTFEHVRNHPSRYFPAWIAKYEQLLSVFELYFQTVYSRSLSSKTAFLLLVQALEAYHRNLYDGKYLSERDYKCARREIKNAIPESVEGEHRRNLEAAINSGNSYSLKTRIIKVCDEILPKYLVNGNVVIVHALIDNLDDFAEKVKATRNHLTHHPNNRGKNVMSDSEIPLYVAKLRFILRICFLVELGFPPDQIKKRVIENPEYKRLTGRW